MSVADEATAGRLTLRQTATFAAHLCKAVLRDHHRGLAPLLSPLLPADAVIMDVGAHAGQFAKLFCRLAPAGTVWAFEPGRYPRRILATVARARGLRNLRIVPMGLADAEAAAELETPLKRSGSLGFGLAHLGAGDGGRPVRRETVTLTTLDAFAAAQGLSRLDLMKADIEGWEMRLLRGGRGTIDRLRPAILLELVGAHLARAGDRPTEAWTMLAPLGYRARRLMPDGELQPVNGFDGDGDYLFIPDGAPGRGA